MSKQALALLRTLGLLTPRNEPADLTLMPDDQLRSSLAAYHAASDLPATDVVATATSDSLSALLSSISVHNKASCLLPALLVFRHVVFDDPVFCLATPGAGFAAMWRCESDTPAPDRRSILDALRHLSEIAPLVEAELVTLLPLSSLHRPRGGVPILASNDRFRSAVPDHVYAMARPKARISPAHFDKSTGAFCILPGRNAEPRRAIAISFDGDHRDEFALYTLQQGRAAEFDRATGRCQFSMNWDPNAPVESTTFDAWVDQSINQTLVRRLADVVEEIRLADSIGHVYVTESAFESSLLGASGARTSTVGSAVQFLRANGAMLNIQSAAHVLAIRENSAQTVTRFQASLLAIAESLHGLDPEDFAEKAKRLYLTEVVPQIEEMQDAARAVARSAVKGGLVALGAIAIALATGTAVPLAPALLFAVASSLTEAYPTVADYLRKKKRPQFIWRQLAQQSD